MQHIQKTKDGCILVIDPEYTQQTINMLRKADWKQLTGQNYPKALVHKIMPDAEVSPEIYLRRCITPEHHNPSSKYTSKYRESCEVKQWRLRSGSEATAEEPG